MNRGMVDVVRLGPRRDVGCYQRDDDGIDEIVKVALEVLNRKESSMHYKNGREAKNGDKVMILPDLQYGGLPVVGILYDARAGNNTCNGKLAVTKPNDPCPNLAECLHVDDVRAALGEIGKVPDISTP